MDPKEKKVKEEELKSEENQNKAEEQPQNENGQVEETTPPTREEELEKELEKIRTLGYATDDEEEMQGVNCLAAPVFNSFGEIAAALWTSGPSGRLTRESFPDMAVRIIEAADAISLRLGFKRR